MQKTTIFRGLEIVMLVAVLTLSACGGGTGSNAGTTTSTASTNGGTTSTSGGTTTATYIFSWDTVSAPSVTGYRIYYGTAPLTNQSPLGTIDTTVTSIEFSPEQHQIAVGTELYMAVSALGTNGAESPVSKTVSIVVQ